VGVLKEMELYQVKILIPRAVVPLLRVSTKTTTLILQHKREKKKKGCLLLQQLLGFQKDLMRLQLGCLLIYLFVLGDFNEAFRVLEKADQVCGLTLTSK
jgi:hypothetical protein